MDTELSRSGVFLSWTALGKVPNTTSSGFVCKKDRGGIFILTTCHQIDDLVDNYNSVNYDNVYVRVTLFDFSEQNGRLVGHDRFIDIAMIYVGCTRAELSTRPMAQIQPPMFSTDPLYPLQLISTIHNPAMDMNRGHLFFQQDAGHIVDPSIVVHVEPMPPRLHFFLPLAMSGSSGAPLFDRNTKKLLGMIVGTVYGTTNRRNEPIRRNVAISLDSIRSFFRIMNFHV